MLSVSRDNSIDLPWHLAVCRPNQGHIAFRNLVRAGFSVFIPHHKAIQRGQGRQNEVLRPLFGGYLFFANNNGDARWQEVAKTHGISALVKSASGIPASVPSKVVAGLMARCNAEGCLIPSSDFVAGETLRINAGPFTDFVGTVEKIDQDLRVHMLLDMLGRKTSTTVAHLNVERTR